MLGEQGLPCRRQVPVRRDLRATSLPLLLLGAATVVGVLPQVLSQGWNIGVLGGGDWASGAPRVSATVLGLIVTLSVVGLVLLVYTGPFIIC